MVSVSALTKLLQPVFFAPLGALRPRYLLSHSGNHPALWPVIFAVLIDVSVVSAGFPSSDAFSGRDAARPSGRVPTCELGPSGRVRVL